MRFTWDSLKAIMNAKKHNVTFEEAAQVFNDPLHLSILDHRFSYFEERWITLGETHGRRLIVVAHLLFDPEGEEVIRILSAREATQNERQRYENY
ncbi:MAG: BrnT family toxin [Spirochaetia bacterium]|jgi:uncharacterized DUF497 family protein|nr:BrnT family toxin [Spirochaetales bacterium]MDX9784695.1 BrnT family toxin [Spirochaetia bacterium]